VSNVDCTARPAPPSSMAVVSASAQSIQLSWTDNSAFEDGYEIERLLPYEHQWIIARLPPNATTYTDAFIASNRQYRYRVRAIRDGGTSEYSSFVAATATTIPPAAPSYVDAWPRNSTTALLVWNVQQQLADGFHFERSMDHGTTWTHAGTQSIDSYEFSDPDRSSESEVCYRIKAFNGAGVSGPSPMDCMTPPLAPTNLIALDSVPGFAWTDNSAVEDGYEVRVCCGGEDMGEYSLFFPPNTTRYEVDANVWYVIGIRATRDGGGSDWLAIPGNSAGSASLRTARDSARLLPPRKNGGQRIRAR
jgi:Fibronectin type III domain